MSLLQWAPRANLLFFQCMRPCLKRGNRLKPVKLMLKALSQLLQLSASQVGVHPDAFPAPLWSVTRHKVLWAQLHVLRFGSWSHLLMPPLLTDCFKCALEHGEEHNLQGTEASSARSRLLERFFLSICETNGWDKAIPSFGVLHWLQGQMLYP